LGLGKRFERVKFYSPNDFTCGHNLEKAEKVIKLFSPENEDCDVNHIMELYNIQLFFDNEGRLRKWNDNEYETLKNTVNLFGGTIARFFNKIDNNNVLCILNELGNDSKDINDFWFLFNKYKRYEIVLANIIGELLDFHISFILKRKETVSAYGALIADYFISRPSCAEYLVNEFLAMKELAHERFYFPKELDADKKSQVLQNYINCNTANPNYLKLIVTAPMQDKNELPLNNQLRLSAKEKLNSYWEEKRKTSPSFGYGTEVVFSKKQEDASNSERLENRTLRMSYSVKWITENIDYPTLLNNFIYLFEYVDERFRSNFISKTSQLGIFERFLGMKGVREYPVGIYFNQMNMLHSLQMVGYCEQLEKVNIQIESIFKWFFEEYLKDEFQVEGFVFHAPSKGTTALERCKLLSIEIESVLKQFFILVTNRKIERDLLEISSTPLRVGDVPSFIAEKYIHPKNDICKKAIHFLFSDQAGLSYTEKTKEKSYQHFAELLYKEQMYEDDFYDYQKEEINWLVKNGCLFIDESSQVQLNTEKVGILLDLHNNEVGRLCYFASRPKEMSTLEKMQADGEIEYSTSLFSLSEQRYLNFILNKAEFSNGLDLRNKYLHASHSLLEKDHESDYAQLLKIMVLTIIKINEEFCLREKSFVS